MNRHWVFLSAYGLDRAFAFSANILRGQTKFSDKRFNFSSGVSQFSLVFLSDLSFECFTLLDEFCDCSN